MRWEHVKEMEVKIEKRMDSGGMQESELAKLEV